MYFQDAGSAPLLGAGFLFFLLMLAGAVVLALLPYYYLSQIRRNTEQSRNNLRDLNARLDAIDQRLNIVVPKVVLWLEKHQA